MFRVDIIRDGEVDLVDNPVPSTLAHPAGHAKELPGCILGEETFLSSVRTPEPTMGAGILWVGLSRDVDVLTLVDGSHLVINKGYRGSQAGGHEARLQARQERRHPPPEEVMEQRKKKPAGRNRQAKLDVT